jgi:hypothetical protein
MGFGPAVPTAVGATTHTQDALLKWRAGGPERPAFAARDGASKTPGSDASCVGGGAAAQFRCANAPKHSR